MDIVEGRASAHGLSRLVLDVEAKNEGAIRFYESRGMTVVSQRPRMRFIPAGTLRMAKELCRESGTQPRAAAAVRE